MITASLIIIAAAAVMTIIRLLRGPSSFDRLMASDTLAVMAAAFLALFSVFSGGKLYIDVAIVYAVAGFVGVVIIARYLQGADR